MKFHGQSSDHATGPAFSPRVVVLKRDRLYGDFICRQIKELWRDAAVQVFQLGKVALAAIRATDPDLFISGVNIEDMDGLEHLEPFAHARLPILVVTSRKEARTFEMLRALRFEGLYDGHAEGMENLPLALQQVIQRKRYVSPTMVEHLKHPKRIRRDELTEREQVVLAALGDGTDDTLAAFRLGISPHTVSTHRKSIMAKLGLHHKGELILYALQRGYVWVTPEEIFYPGFKRRLRTREVSTNILHGKAITKSCGT